MCRRRISPTLFPVNGGWPGQTLEQDDPGGIQIAAVGLFLVQQTCCLWRKIVSRSTMPVLRTRFQANVTRAAEVNQGGFVQVPVFVDDHIGRIHIAMQDIVRMCPTERSQDRTRDRDRLAH